VKNKREQLTRDRLQTIAAYKEKQYQRIDLTGLASFVIKWLQDQHIPTTFENIVVALFRMFPLKFALEGYPDYPDAARVGRSLLQLGPKYRNWARGSVQKGFVLTDSGLTKVARVRQILMTSELPNQETFHKRKPLPRTMDLSKELAPLESSPLFQMWKEGKLAEGNTMEFLIMLGAYSYTPIRAIRDRVKLLKETASQAGRDDLAVFLKDVQKIIVQRLGNGVKGGSHA
jgi:hypothetical protein